MAKITWRTSLPDNPIYQEPWTVGPVKGIRHGTTQTGQSSQEVSRPDTSEPQETEEAQIDRRWKALIDEDFFHHLFEWLRLDGLDITFEDLEWLWDAIFEVDKDFLGDLTGHALFTRMAEVTIDCYCPPGTTTLFRPPWDLEPVLVNYDLDEPEMTEAEVLIKKQALIKEHGENPDKKWKRVFTTVEMWEHYKGFREDNPDLTWQEFEEYIESHLGD